MNEAIIQQTADRQAITDLIYRYCRAMDRIDAEIGYSIWHDDAVADYGDVFKGSGRGFIDFVNAQHEKCVTHTHQITNVIIELDGDRAGSEAYVYSVVRFMRGEQLGQVITWGRYLDQWSRREGRWGIDKRVAIRDFDEISDVAATGVKTVSPRDRSDPSYLVLKGPR